MIIVVAIDTALVDVRRKINKTMKKSKVFKCNCQIHSIEVDTTPINNIEYIGLAIYEYRSTKTGKIYKKPRELGTVCLIGKEAIKFKKLISKGE